MAAGAAGAINNSYDADIDGVMAHAAAADRDRPDPAGRRATFGVTLAMSVMVMGPR